MEPVPVVEPAPVLELAPNVESTPEYGTQFFLGRFTSSRARNMMKIAAN